MLVMQISVVLAIGIIIYALFEIFRPQEEKPAKKKKSEDRLVPVEDPNKEQRIQRLQRKVVELENELEKNKIQYAQEKAQISTAKDNEGKFSDELKRREDWVAKAEAEVVKIKAENADLSNKFIAKEKELGEEFAKNVNFSREIQQLKASLEAKEMACRLKEDQIQAQKHQLESQLKTANEHLTKIAEFDRKEKISEWVPKAEFNKLNEEYSALEKELEEVQGRLKSFAEEIARLRKEAKPAEEIKQTEEPKPAQETGPLEEAKPEEVVPTEEKIEKPAEENKPKEKEG